MREEKRTDYKVVVLCVAIIAAMITMLVVNGIVFRGAYQCSLCVVLLTVALISFFTAGKTKRAFCVLCVLVFASVYLYVGFFPRYSVKKAEERILSKEASITELNYYGNIDTVTKNHILCETKAYVFSYGEPKKKIIFFPSGKYVYEDW
ncbi:MAG: hypothetical protein ACI4HI_14455 [Lachnospiraceae bacterium]